MKIKGLAILFNYGPEYLKRNTHFVLTVLKRSDNKVQKVTVVERKALGPTYESLLREYPAVIYTHLISTTSIIGEVLGFESKDLGDEGKESGDVFSGHVN